MGLLGCAWVLCRVSADDESTTHAPTLWDDDWRPPAPTAHVEQQNTTKKQKKKPARKYPAAVTACMERMIKELEKPEKAAQGSQEDQ